MAYQLTVLYHHPDDVAAFDRHSRTALAAEMPGLRSYTVCRPARAPTGTSPAITSSRYSRGTPRRSCRPACRARRGRRPW